jgi:hypothetical protein
MSAEGGRGGGARRGYGRKPVVQHRDRLKSDYRPTDGIGRTLGTHFLVPPPPHILYSTRYRDT